MKKINTYLLQADNDKEYDDYVNENLKNTFDVTLYLNLLKTNQSKLLLDIIDYNIEFFDHNNVCVNFENLKKTLKLGDRFGYVIDPKKPLSVNNIKINLNSLVLTKDEASNLCTEIHNEIFDGITKVKGITNKL